MTYDKYYAPLHEKTHDSTILKEAGWLDKPTNIDFQTDNYVTPVGAIRDHPQEELSVLLYPGCFAPIHEGHFQAMQEAKRTVEEHGETVAAGFFAPDHDDYILRKTKDYRFTAPNRIALIEEKISAEDWMQVDPWASTYAPTDLNFTTLHARLEEYLRHWVPNKKIKLYLVFGGDNYLFANAFTEHGYGVCISREGTTLDYAKLQPETKGRVLFNNKTLPNYSSTELRRTGSFLLNPQTVTV